MIDLSIKAEKVFFNHLDEIFDDLHDEYICHNESVVIQLLNESIYQNGSGK